MFYQALKHSLTVRRGECLTSWSQRWDRVPQILLRKLGIYLSLSQRTVNVLQSVSEARLPLGGGLGAAPVGLMF